jgi:5'-3' exoribonuclease 1
MTDPKSPILHFYPLDFRTDLNGKKAEWEAVVLVPFIDQVWRIKDFVYVNEWRM